MFAGRGERKEANTADTRREKLGRLKIYTIQSSLFRRFSCAPFERIVASLFLLLWNSLIVYHEQKKNRMGNGRMDKRTTV